MFLFTVGSSNAEKFLAFTCLTFSQYDNLYIFMFLISKGRYCLFYLLYYVHLNVLLPIVLNTSRMVVEKW